MVEPEKRAKISWASMPASKPSYTHHVLSWCNKFHDAVIQLGPSPSIGRLILFLVPIKQLWNLVGDVAHAALPPLTTFNELDVRIDVCAAPSASRNDSVAHDRHRLVTVLFTNRSIGRENEAKRQS